MTLRARAVAIAALTMIGCAPDLPSGPVEIVWDQEVCAECRMHIGEPHFAAQLQTREGEVHSFDDVGCMIRYRDANRPRIHAMWLRDSGSDGWLRYEEAAFVEAVQSPMGYGLAAVPRGTPQSFSIEEGEARVRARASR